jgi:anti-sigma-K factor RskA
MSSQNENQFQIIEYLLGRLSESERERFERQYLMNEDLFNLLQEVEEELIDDYATGALTAEQRLSFEKYFLRSAGRREKLAFATALTEHALARQGRTLLAADKPARAATSRALPGSASSRHVRFRHSPVPGWRQWVAIAAAAVLAIAIGILWLRNRQLQHQLLTVNATYARLRQEAEAQLKIATETKAALSAEQQQTQMLEAQVEQLQASPADKIGDTIVSIALGLDYLVASTRGAEKKVKPLAVPAQARLVRLTLDLAGSSFESFNILLRRGDENVVWRRSGLTAKPATANRRKLNLSIPAEHLTPGDYEVLLLGVPPEGDAEMIGRYFLKVERKRATR